MLKKLLSLSMGMLLAVQSITADTYFKPTQQGYEHVVFLLDWDSVIADDKGRLAKFFSALGAVPVKKSLPIVFRRMGKLIKTLKESRNDGQALKGVAAHIDCMVEQEPSLKPYRDRLMQKLNDAKPRCEMVSYIQEMQNKGIKLISATNNDYESLSIKLKKLNARLINKKRKPFRFDGYFCAGSCPQIVNNRVADGTPAGSVYAGKDSDEYFEKLFAFVETEFGYNRSKTLFVFVDDLKKNITRARNVAEREGVSLCAVHRNRSDKKIVAEMKKALSDYLPSYTVAA